MDFSLKQKKYSAQPAEHDTMLDAVEVRVLDHFRGLMAYLWA